MLFSDIFIFMYIFAGFAGFLAILLAVTLIRHWPSGNKGLLGAIRNFVICTVLMDILYLLFEYDMLTSDIYKSNPVVRIIDIGLFVAQTYFWIDYMWEKSMIPSENRKGTVRFSIMSILTALALAIVLYCFMMDDYYHINGTGMRFAGTALEIVIGVLLTVSVLMNLKKALPEVMQRKCRRLMIWITLVMVMNGLWNGLDVTFIIWEKGYILREYIDPTPILLLVVNALAMWIIQSEDFTAIFKIVDSSDRGTDELTKRLDYIAETHFLTEREREVMELAYKKMTNPEIAEELCISKYTVKNHMHNIFEKLDISTRSDLVLFVDHRE